MDMRMREYLDEACGRLGTNCNKWDGLERFFGRSDLVAMWVADMDFRTVPEVKDALVERAQHAIYGYTDNSKAEREAEKGWLSRRHGLEIAEDWIVYSPSVVDSIYFCVRALTGDGDKIMIQTPVYGPFYSAIETFGRTMVKNPLIHEGVSEWKMDFENMEAGFAQGVKMFILCSPHNPIGKVWKKEELEKLLELANRYGVIVVADEIHAEFVMDGRKQVRILSLEGSDNCVMLNSSTKAFNLAGLRQSSMIIPNETIRKTVQDEIVRANAGTPNIFGSIAQTAAFTHGDEWMDAVVEYVQENRDFAVRYIRENIPEIICYPQEGTYLMWLDLRGLNMSREETVDFLINKAHVAMNDGSSYGPEGEGFFRMNLGTQRANVVKTLENIREAIRSK